MTLLNMHGGDLYQIGRLYLCKEINKEIYVDNIESLSQHHVDGIRFLYLQFKKKYPGVILNDPSGLGKCLITVFFLKTVQHLLAKPTLIIASDETNLLKWTEHCEKSGIEVESKNPLAKKQVFITTLDNIQSFNIRDWSIVVIRDNHASKEIIQTAFKSEFKIWIASVDLKVKLKTLQSIYVWVTKEKLDIKQFTPEDDPYDMVTKSMLLDTFLEDTYFRVSYTFTPVLKEVESEIVSVKRKVISHESRKNKDASGTKIKKSKRRLDDEDLPDLPHEEVSNKDNIESKEKYNSTEECVDVSTVSRMEGADSPTLLTEDNFLAQNELPENVLRIDQSLSHSQECQGEETDSQNIYNFKDAIQDIVDNENDMAIAPTTHEENSNFKLETDFPNTTTIGDQDQTDKPIENGNNRKSNQSIESKLLELEEMALKKFKGSFLDSIF